MKEQLEPKQVESNSGLGEALNYMLKTAIRHRKNSLSYKTLNGARIGDIHMSLIHT